MSAVGIEIVKGVKWNLLATFTTQVVNIGLMLFLIKKLTPDDFGIFGMISVFIGFSTLLIDLGFSAAIIQAPALSHSLKSTVFWGNFCIGVFLFILLFCLSGPISRFYDKEELALISKVFGLSFIFSAIGITNNALAQKSMQFNYLAISDVGSKVASAIVAIVLVLLNYGVWALVISNLVGTLSLSVIIIALNRWIPGLIFRFSDLKSILRFGLEYSFVRLFLYGIRKLDEVMLGKYSTAASLGLYNTATRIVFMPMNLLKSKVVNVLFPAFSKIQGNIDEIRKISLRLVGLLSMFALPVLSVVWMVAPDFVYGYMGEEWFGLVVIVQWLVIAFSFDMVQFPRAIMLSQGLSTRYLKMMVVYRLFTFFGVAGGLYWGGVEGLLYGLTITSFLSFVPMIWYTGKVIGLTIGNYLRRCVPAVIFCLISILLTLLLTDHFLVLDYFIARGLTKIFVFMVSYIFFSMWLMRISVLNNVILISSNIPGRFGRVLNKMAKKSLTNRI